jgi:nickel transport protein
MKTWLLGCLLSTGLVIGSSSPALAHAVETDYFVDLFAAELALEFTASFSTGEPMAEASVVVYAPNDTETPWAEGQTNADGQFTFEPDPELVGDWRIEFKQGGHEDIRIVPIDDLGIDYQNISHGGSRDVHLANNLPSSLAIFSMAGVGAAAIFLQRRLFRR